MIKLKLLLVGLFLFLFFITQGQTKNEIITISSINIELNGNKIVIDTSFSEQLVLEIPAEILIYNADFVSYWAVFTYKHKGSRAKLERITYAELPDGKKVYSKKKKDMQELKVSVPGMFKGKSAESILYAKKTMGNIFVSFNYEYRYKE